MITQDNIDQFYKDVEELKLKFPIAAIAKATGESKGNVSRYLSKKQEPSEPFLIKFYDSFKIVPRNTLPEPAQNGTDKQAVVIDYELFKQLIAEKEARRLDAEEKARQAREDLNDVKAEKKELLAIIKENLTALQVNSAKNQEYLIKIYDEQTSDDLVIMDNQDAEAKNPAGTSAAKSGSYQLKLATARKEAQRRGGKDKTAKADRSHKS